MPDWNEGQSGVTERISPSPGRMSRSMQTPRSEPPKSGLTAAFTTSIASFLVGRGGGSIGSGSGVIPWLALCASSSDASARATAIISAHGWCALNIWFQYIFWGATYCIVECAADSVMMWPGFYPWHRWEEMMPLKLVQVQETDAWWVHEICAPIQDAGFALPSGFKETRHKAEAKLFSETNQTFVLLQSLLLSFWSLQMLWTAVWKLGTTHFV